MKDIIEDFEVDHGMSIPARVAAYLDWAARTAPTRPISFQQICKVVMQLPRVPTEKDRRTQSVRLAIRRAKPILMNRYRRGIVPHPGFGVRATIDSEDVARTQFQADKRRAVSALKSIDRTSSLINASEIDDRELKASVTSTRKVMRLLISNDVFNKLLPEHDKKNGSSNGGNE